MCTGNHTPQKNSFRCGVITELSAFPHSNLNSRKSAERSNEGMRSKTQSPQAALDLQKTSSRLVEHLHVMLWTQEGSKGSRICWASSWQILPLRIIKQKNPTYIQKATGLKVENERDGKINGEVIILPCTYIFIKSIPLASTGDRMLKYNRPLVWCSVDLPSYTGFWSIGSQNSKKALQWADDVRLWWNKQCELPTPHRGSQRSVFLHSGFSEL